MFTNTHRPIHICSLCLFSLFNWCICFYPFLCMKKNIAFLRTFLCIKKIVYLHIFHVLFPIFEKKLNFVFFIFSWKILLHFTRTKNNPSIEQAVHTNIVASVKQKNGKAFNQLKLEHFHWTLIICEFIFFSEFYSTMETLHFSCFRFMCHMSHKPCAKVY